MKQFRRIRLLAWFCLLWLGGITVYWNSWSWKFTSMSTTLHLLVTLLMLIHLSIYWIGLSIEIKKGMQWAFLCIQTGLILLLTLITHLVLLTLALSPLLFIVATIVLKQVRAMLIFIGSYFVCMLFYVQTIGLSRDWSDIWGGGYAPGVGFLGLFFLVALLLYLQQIQQAHERTLTLLRELDVAHIQLSAYALRIEELTMINERQRIARDLHDTLVQGVAGLLMQLNVVHTQLQHRKIERAQELLVQVMESASDTLSDARCAIGDLRTGQIRPEDLVEVVQEEISRFTATTDIACHAELEALTNTPASWCEHVLRAISEGLTNVARHAHASTVWVQVSYCDDMLTVIVRDNGVGFDPEKIKTEAGHYGLLGMCERARLIGGQLEVTSTKGLGTILRFRVPVRSVTHQKGEE